MSDSADRYLKQAEQARREGRFGEAKQFLVSAIEIFRGAGAPIRLALALRTLGEVERRLDNNAAARQAYEASVAMLRRLEEPRRLAHTVRHLGDVYLEMGLVAHARPCYLEALEIYRGDRRASRLDLANAIRGKAVLEFDHGETDQAAALWDEARGLYATVGSAAGVTESCVRLAYLAHRRGDAAQARDWLQQAATAASESEDPITQQHFREAAKTIGGSEDLL